jgi:hypothetical protein
MHYSQPRVRTGRHILILIDNIFTNIKYSNNSYIYEKKNYKNLIRAGQEKQEAI